MAAWVDLAAHDDRVDKALRLLIEPQFSYWVILYNIWGVIQSDVGGRITKDDWASGKQIDRFTRTANSVAVLGDAARKGFERDEPPPDPMSLEEAQALIHRVLRHWLNSKIDWEDVVSYRGQS